MASIPPRDVVRIIGVLINRLNAEDAPPFKPHVRISNTMMRTLTNEPDDAAFKRLLPEIRNELSVQYAWLMMQLVSGDFLLFHSNLTTPFCDVLPYLLTDQETISLSHGDASALMDE